MSKFEKSPVANIRKLLLMKDRSFLYELRAYFVYVKEKRFPLNIQSNTESEFLQCLLAAVVFFIAVSNFTTNIYSFLMI